MSSIGTLYGLENSGKHSRIVAITKFTGLQMDMKETSVYKNDHLSEEYRSLFPYGKVPAFKASNGFTLIENRAIARYVASLAKGYNLLGTDEESSALVEQWIDFVDEELFSIGIKFHHQLTTLTGKKEEERLANEDYQKSKQNLQRALQFLELNLQNQKTKLVGNEITLADLTLITCLHKMFTLIAGPTIRSAYPNIMNYYRTMVQIPKIVTVFQHDGELLQEDR